MRRTFKKPQSVLNTEKMAESQRRRDMLKDTWGCLWLKSSGMSLPFSFVTHEGYHYFDTWLQERCSVAVMAWIHHNQLSGHSDLQAAFTASYCCAICSRSTHCGSINGRSGLLIGLRNAYEMLVCCHLRQMYSWGSTSN